MTKNKRLVVVSNRLPVSIYSDSNNNHQVERGTGGLITALEPVIKRCKGRWIGWPGCSEKVPFNTLLADYSKVAEFSLLPVGLSEKDIEKYYRGFSNTSIWPLFHDLLGQFSFNPDEYQYYRDVNEKFAKVIIGSISNDDLIWVQDYQLIFVGHFLREAKVANELKFFLHIPFPSFDLMRRMPRKGAILKALLQYDQIGFQTATDKRNFISCIKWIVPEAIIMTQRRKTVISYEERQITVGNYPISIDFNEFNDLAKTKESSDAAWFLKENINANSLILGLDRLDYTKGIPQRFLALEKLLEDHEDIHGKISLLQIVVPSRMNVAQYRELKEELEFLAGRINGRFSKSGWIPLHYQFRSLDKHELVGHYKAADIALITPLRDGMNLVAKEYCVSQVDSSGVLILSEFAGSAVQLKKGAIIVNPYDINKTADAIYQAYTMSEEEKASRMRNLRSEIKRNDLNRWIKNIIGDL